MWDPGIPHPDGPESASGVPAQTPPLGPSSVTGVLTRGPEVAVGGGENSTGVESGPPDSREGMKGRGAVPKGPSCSPLSLYSAVEL